VGEGAAKELDDPGREVGGIVDAADGEAFVGEEGIQA
jgi:hypothetical protein